MEQFPPIPLAEWRDTKETLHRFCQVIGKIRLAASVRRNHWWNVPFHLTGRGITTRPMGQIDGNPGFTVDFDFVDHQLHIHTLEGRAMMIPLQGQSVASFSDQTLQALAELEITVAIAHPHPFDLPDADRPFADDTEHASYDPAWASRYWVVLSQVNLVLEEFAARFSGKVSPVHHFWHTFDIAHTRFADRPVDQPPTTDPVTREAYSREVISFGFWFGDDRFAEPAFYAMSPRSRPGWPRSRCSRRPPGGIRATAATWPSCAMTTPAPATTPGPLCWASTRAPIRPAPGWPAGTSGAWPAPAESPTRTCADTKTCRGSGQTNDIRHRRHGRRFHQA
jgi:hypothetical protein